MERVTIQGIQYDRVDETYTPVIKTLPFDKAGGSYQIEDGVLVPIMKQLTYGMYGHRRRDYLQEEKPSLFNELLLQGQLSQQLYEMDEQCYEREKQVEQKMMKDEGITESMKSSDWWTYAQAVERIHLTAQRVVLEEIVYT